MFLATILTFYGMKGTLSIILVHMISSDYFYRELFESVTIVVLIHSIFVYGTILWACFTFCPLKERWLLRKM